MYTKIFLSISILLLITLIVISIVYKNSICGENMTINENNEKVGPIMDTRYKQIHKKNVYVDDSS